MSIEIIILAAVVFVGFLITIFILKGWIREISEKNKSSDELLAFLKSTNTRLDIQGKAINERLDNAARYIASVQKSIGEMSEIGRGMKQLQEFLTSPKLRGNIGEQVLKELLTQMLPKQAFHLQHTFRGGQTVDAAITTSAGMIPVDSKFPLDNFRRLLDAKNDEEKKRVEKEFLTDVKKHVDDISRKYILTEEGTIDYALMYMPSEAVYYEVVNNPAIFEYASSRRVLPVSPMTFYAYLKAILMSFEGQKIEKEARVILSLIRAIQKDYGKVEEQLGVLSKHITNAYNQLSNVVNSFTLLGHKLTTTTTLTQEDKLKQLELEQGDKQ